MILVVQSMGIRPVRSMLVRSVVTLMRRQRECRRIVIELRSMMAMLVRPSMGMPFNLLDFAFDPFTLEAHSFESVQFGAFPLLAFMPFAIVSFTFQLFHMPPFRFGVVASQLLFHFALPDQPIPFDLRGD
jgi:hypothetical protein